MSARICAAPGCGTILSVYNPESLCSACAAAVSRAQDVRERRRATRPVAARSAPKSAPPPARPLSAAVMTTAGQLAVGRWVSGQEIASRAGITRTAVWKHVATLRRAGWQVESRANLGYRLAPSQVADSADFRLKGCNRCNWC